MNVIQVILGAEALLLALSLIWVGCADFRVRKLTKQYIRARMERRLQNLREI